MVGLPAADIVVIVLYLIWVAALGIWMARKVHTTGDFIMPRRFGKWTMMMHGFGTGTHSDQAVSVASKSFTNGLSGIWYQWLWLFATPFYWLIAPVMRRFRAYTTADVFAARYDNSVAVLFAVVGVANLMVNIGVMLKGSSAVITASTGGRLDANTAIAVMTVLFVAYGVAGGLGAAIVTDFVQGILTVVFSFLLLPFILGAAGGMAGIRDKLDPAYLSLVAPGEIGLLYVVVISLNGLVGIVTQPHTMGNCAAGRTEFDGRFGWMAGNFLKRICTVAWCLTGVAALAYYGAAGVDHPDLVFGKVAQEFLPAGLLGLLLASLLASVMSSCDSFMIASSGLFTENVYRVLIPGRSERHYLVVARIAAFSVVAGGVYFAYRLPGVVEGLEIFWKISPMTGVAFWLGLFWRRATVAGAWACVAAGFGVWYLTTTDFFISAVKDLPFAGKLGLIFVESGKPELYLPFQMLMYLGAAATAGIVVSLLTKPVPEEKLERFYALVRTPVRPGEKPPAPCTLPEGAVVPPRKKLLPLKNLEILRPSALSVAGFAAAWLLVAGIIFVFRWIVG